VSSSARCGPAALSRHHCLPSAVPQSASEAPSPALRSLQQASRRAVSLQQPCSGLAFPSMPFHVGTIQSTSREPARSHPRRALGGSGPERDPLQHRYFRAGRFSERSLPASPDPQTRYGCHADTPASSAMRGGKVSLSAAACCVQARCSQSRWGPCCVWAAIRMHTTHVAFRWSVVCGVCTHRVYSPSGQLDRAGGLVRAQAERRCAAVVPGADALVPWCRRDIVWRGEHERPLTLCVSGCVWSLRARMSSISRQPTRLWKLVLVFRKNFSTLLKTP